MLLANGMAGRVNRDRFGTALDRLCLGMAEWLARDGEGAMKLLRVRVGGARSDGEARRVAKAVVDSPLVKTMVHGADPNVGRILMAVGKCVDCRVDPGRVSAYLQGVPVIAAGRIAPFDESALRERLGEDPVEVVIELAVGTGRGLGLGCDLTEGYIEENAAYASS